ncbi:30S ribosomal protein S1 [Paramaledivibacter caminithermalis]|jgi:ribosomal protein S1|uniref:SSU ribosomal protein S1P n=1 Tax=Paramaledivibacter caminithermalis (strain DSM 15212 / CIP 107654 / DViRD3) TaxID=1121301 RepID=A0A1M6JLN0_PARC5|nr:30S ribosomal protein S1 [Paramaledivibacter caminithermalis]SHJ47617.1 SSU ribosomal protein S1P [Paramaledivibacter caminithermalis DSM 15212]
MENNNNIFNELLEQDEKLFTIPRRGNIIKGKVVQVTDQEIVVNIGYKSDGIIPLNEFSNNLEVNPKDIIKEGDEIDVYVLKSDDGEGNVVLSKKRVDAIKDWENLEKSYNDEKIVTIKTGEVVKGGIIAYFNELRGFIPASQISNEYVENLNEYSNKELEVKVIDIDRKRNKAIFSHRKVLEEKLEGKKKEFWNNLEKDIVIKGEVTRITNFGAFVDLGGVDGLIHISEMSWGRIKHPAEILNIGDIVEVYVKEFDKEKGKISLSLKQVKENPWERIEDKYSLGDIVEGKIVSLVDFGAFVELEEGVEGLVHISQISENRIAKPSEVLEEGQTVKVKILDIDMENKKISLSIKEAQATKDIEDYLKEAENEETSTIGDIIKSKED